MLAVEHAFIPKDLTLQIPSKSALFPADNLISPRSITVPNTIWPETLRCASFRGNGIGTEKKDCLTPEDFSLKIYASQTLACIKNVIQIRSYILVPRTKCNSDDLDLVLESLNRRA